MISSNCKNEDEKIFKEEEWDIKDSWFIWIYNYFKNMAGENISRESRLKNIDETRNYFIK